MREFAALYDMLDSTTSTLARVAAMRDYFSRVPSQDASWALWILTGMKHKRAVSSTQLRRWAAEVTGMPDGPMHDPCAVLALTHPALFERQPLHCEVELAGGTRGMLVADLRFPKLSAAPNAEVLRRMDADAARRVLAEAVLGAVGA